jgi:hypothetical protein
MIQWFHTLRKSEQMFEHLFHLKTLISRTMALWKSLLLTFNSSLKPYSLRFSAGRHSQMAGAFLIPAEKSFLNGGGGWDSTQISK